MNFLDLKARTRRSVHRVFAVTCVLSPGTRGGTDINLTARFHNKMALGGDLSGEGYAAIIEGIQRVVFNREELLTATNGGPVVLVRGDVVRFPDYIAADTDLVLELDARDPYEGPIDEKWSVAPGTVP